MRLFSYVLDHDFGFAPNPFHGACTLATCKPKIRGTAKPGDIVMGTGCAKRKRRGFLVYYMVVSEVMTFEQYWNDGRFASKRPTMRGSIMQAVGDNIYHRDPVGGGWLQENSLHSLADGTPNPKNITHDTRIDRILVAKDFAYWGGLGPAIPESLRNFQGHDVVARRSHRSVFSSAHVAATVEWLGSLGPQGYKGKPLNWAVIPRSTVSISGAI